MEDVIQVVLPLANNASLAMKVVLLLIICLLQCTLVESSENEGQKPHVELDEERPEQHKQTGDEGSDPHDQREKEAFQNEVEAENRRRRVVPELPYALDIFERTETWNTATGANAMQSFIDLMKEQRYTEARIKYKEADWNLPFGELVTVNGMDHQYYMLRDAANYFLDKGVKRNVVNLDLGYMHFGHRNEYAFHRIKHHERRAEIIKQLEDDVHMTPDDVQARMRPDNIDVRDHCDEMQDVAEIYAEAFHWDKALEVMDNITCLRTVAHKAALIGAFAIGVPTRMKVDNKDIVEKVIDYGMYLKDHRRKSTELQAAMVTLHLHVRRKIFALEPQILEDPNQVMVLYYPNLYGQLAQIETEKLSEALDKSTLVYIHFITVIKEKFRLQRSIGVHAYYTYTRLLYEYYKKAGNPWLAWIWLQEAFPSRPGRTEDSWMRTCYKLIRRLSARELYQLSDPDRESTDAFDLLKNDIQRWTGTPPGWQTNYNPKYAVITDTIFNKFEEAKKAEREKIMREGIPKPTLSLRSASKPLKIYGEKIATLPPIFNKVGGSSQVVHENIDYSKSTNIHREREQRAKMAEFERRMDELSIGGGRGTRTQQGRSAGFSAIAARFGRTTPESPTNNKPQIPEIVNA
ncbi:hypothetical protein PSACC_03188 [Paramicrosporidium saccamoebae]|uniref:Uncharacterized protein n=1 Tax=Paramicrosporidium saccamoebae TaxID=1246581 RepID=A0A2H9TGW4_9FUNG|nr:hypothetical protein PSACC_03188 [Paramicrosporidium saccamoebae]